MSCAYRHTMCLLHCTRVVSVRCLCAQNVNSKTFRNSYLFVCRSQWPSGLRRRYVAYSYALGVHFTVFCVHTFVPQMAKGCRNMWQSARVFVCMYVCNIFLNYSLYHKCSIDYSLNTSCLYSSRKPVIP
jgi:hypothetical protein